MQSLLDGLYGEEEISAFLEGRLSKYGRIKMRSGGMCGTVYFFDQGENVHPRWVAAKIPRVPAKDRSERNRRFLREIEIQHRTFYHRFVCWPFDYEMVLDTPVALYRASDGDLAQWIPRQDFSPSSRLAVLIYLCSALRHCRSRGMECHQDLKPQNILMRAAVDGVGEISGADVFEFPQLADFGLANMGLEGHAEGARPYMAPEQWLADIADGDSDIFALGVIIFEVMTAGEHPYGGTIREWWPDPEEGKSKRWLRPDIWKKWAEAGNPITPARFLVDGVDHIARKCMSPSPSDRPTLDHIQAELLAVLLRHDPPSAIQAEFQFLHAEADPNDGSWPYRDERLDLVRRWITELDA